MRRSNSALARFTRSVTKLRSHRRRASELPSVAAFHGDEEDDNDGDGDGDDDDNLNRRAAPIQRLHTAPIQSTPYMRRGDSTYAAKVPTAPDPAVFLRAVPDMLSIDAALISVRAALKGAEGMAKMLRDGAGDPDPTTPHQSTLLVPTHSAAAAAPPSDSIESARNSVHHEREREREWELKNDLLEAALAENRFEDAVEQLKQLVHQASTSIAQQHEQHAWVLQRRADEAGSRLVSALCRRISLSDAVYSPTLENERPLLTVLSQVVGSAAAVETLLSVASARLRDHLDALPVRHHLHTGGGGGSGGNVNGTGSGNATSEDAAVDVAAALGQTLANGIIGGVDATKLLLSSSSSSSSSTTSSTTTNTGGLAQWVYDEVAYACEMLKKVVILPRAAPAGLLPTCRCLAVFLAHCDAIEDVVHIPCVGQLARDAVWPGGVEPVLQRRVRQVCDGLKKAAAGEASRKTAVPNPSAASWDALCAVYPSAKRMLSELRVIADAVVPIAGPAAVMSMQQCTTVLFLVRFLLVQVLITMCLYNLHFFLVFVDMV